MSEEITKLLMHPAIQAAGINETFAELLLSDIAESLSNRGVDAGKCPALVRRIAVIWVNRLGSEGVSSESYSGVSQSFLEDLPHDIRSEINALRVVKWS